LKGEKGKLISLTLSQASHRSRVRVRVPSSFVRRKAVSPSSFPSTATQDTQDTHPAQPRSCPVQSLVHYHHHCTTAAPPSLRAHPPLHPTATSGSRIPRSPPLFTTHAPYELHRHTSAIHSSLLLANHSPAAISQPPDHLPFAPPHKAPPGAHTLLRCCYQREA
jgi:hypothetical protein